MGTRHVILIYYKKRYRIAQYGYPYYTGVGVLAFLSKEGNIAKLKEALDMPLDLEVLNNRDLGHEFLDVLIEEAAKFKVGQDTSKASGLAISAQYAEPPELNFVYDTIFCEFSYVIDLDNGLFESYGEHGFDSLRFKFRDRGTRGMTSNYSLDRLPDKNQYLIEVCGGFIEAPHNTSDANPEGQSLSPSHNFSGFDDIPIEIFHRAGSFLDIADILILGHTSRRFREVFLQEHFIISLLCGRSSILAVKANEQLQSSKSMSMWMILFRQFQTQMDDLKLKAPGNGWISRHLRFLVVFQATTQHTGHCLKLHLMDRFAISDNERVGKEEEKAFEATPPVMSLKIDASLRAGANKQNTNILFEEERMILIVEYRLPLLSGTKSWTSTDIEIWDLNRSTDAALKTIAWNTPCHAFPHVKTETLAIHDFENHEVHFYSLSDLEAVSLRHLLVIDKVAKPILLDNSDWPSFFLIRQMDGCFDIEISFTLERHVVEHWLWSFVHSDDTPKPVQVFDVVGNWQFFDGERSSFTWDTNAAFRTHGVVIDRTTPFAIWLFDGMLYYVDLASAEHRILRDYGKLMNDQDRMGIEFGWVDDEDKVYVRRVLEYGEPTYELIDTLQL